MKKVMYLFGFLICSMTTLVGFRYSHECNTDEFFINKEIPIMTSNTSGSGGNPPIFNEDCTFTYQYFPSEYIYLANLDFDPVTGWTYPSGIPTLYYRVTMSDDLGNEVSEIHSLDNWSFYGLYGDGDEQVFRATATSSLELDSYCEPGDPSIQMSFTHELLQFDESTGSYLPYPILSFNNSAEVYSCQVFEDIPCDSEMFIGGSSFGNLYTYNTLGQNIGCPSCTEKSSVNEDKPLFNFSANPNPFSSEFVINWSGGTKEKLGSQLFNAIGELVATIDLNNDFGRVIFDASNLPKGTYFLVVKSENKKEVIKLIKQ